MTRLSKMAPPITGPPPSGSEKSADSSMMNGEATPSNGPGATSEPQRVWERPWTLEEMRKGAHNWSLASDAGMLQYLQDFSQRLVNQTHEIQKQMDGLLDEVKRTNVRVDSTFNDFIMLANTQFVENRVYDEDVSQEKTEDDKAKEKEKTREEREADLIPKINEALSLGMSVIDCAFEKLDVNVANSDSEDDDDSPYKNDPILEPKDPYISRPLPYIIGSQAFYQDDDVGLVDEPSDEAVSDHGSISQSESESESEKEEDIMTQSKPKPEKDMFTDSEAEYESEESELFGEKASNHEEEDSFSESEPSDQSGGETKAEHQPSGPSDFASELASKIGALPPRAEESNEDEPKQRTEEKRKDSKKRKSGSHKHKSQTQAPPADADDLFGPPPNDNDDLFAPGDSPFGKPGGLFSSSKGLFDDDDEEGNQGDLFGESSSGDKKPSNDPLRQSSGLFDDDDNEPKAIAKEVPKASQKVTKSGKKVPAGGVSLFADDDGGLFSGKPEPPEDDFMSSHSSTQSSKDKHSNKAPVKKVSGGLFDDDNDEDDDDDGDLFAGTSVKKDSAKESQPKAPKQNLFSGGDLFGDEGGDDEEDDGDLFSKASSAKPMAKTEGAKPKTDSTQKKLPPGAVSMFGGAPNPLAAALKAKMPQPAQSDGEGSFSDEDQSSASHSSRSSSLAPPKAAPFNPLEGKKEPSPAPSTGSLFAEEPEDLFASEAPKPPTQRSSAPLPKNKGLFGGDEEDDQEGDLFSSITNRNPGAAARSSPPKASAPSKGKPSLLFSDEDEEDKGDLFAAAKPAETSVKKKPVGGVALFGGADLFGSASPPKEVAPKVPEEKASQPAARPKKTSISLFDDDAEDGGDLFGGSKPVDQQPATKAEGARPRTKSKSLFEDEDLLFGATSSENPEVDLFGPSSPVSPDQEKDLFASSPPKPSVNAAKKPVKPKPPSKAAPKSDLFGSSPEDDLFAPVTKKPPQKSMVIKGATTTESSSDIPTKPVEEQPKETPKAEPTKSRSLLSAGVLDPSSLKTKAISPTVNTEEYTPLPPAESEPSVSSTEALKTAMKASKLKPNLMINPAALLPGAKAPLPRRQASQSSEDSTPSVKDQPIAIGASAQILPSAEAPVGFDQPASASTLECVAKNRARVRATRRPPTRKRGAAIVPASPEVSDQPSGDLLSRNPPDLADFASDNTDLFSPAATAAPLAEESRIPPVLPESHQEDLISSPESAKEPEKAMLIDSAFTPEPPPLSSNWDEDEDEDDIFGTKHVTIKKMPTRDMADNTSDVPPEAAPSGLDEDEDDLFSGPSVKPKTEPVKSKDPIPVPSKEDDLFGASLNTKPSKPTEVPKILDDDDDIFGNSSVSKTKQQPVNNDEDIFSSKSSGKSKGIMLDDDEDDIFGSVSAKSASKAVKVDEEDDIFGSAASKPVSKAVKDDDIFGSSHSKPSKASGLDDDIFGQASSKAPKTEPADDDDDIFGSSTSKPAPKPTTLDEDDDIFGSTKPPAKSSDNEDIFGESFKSKSNAKGKILEDEDNDDDIFASASSSTKKKKRQKEVTKDEALFKDDTDIFADVPSVRPKEKKKKAKETKSLFKDDVDDIFAPNPSKPKSTKKAAPKSSKKSPAAVADDIFADNSPSIFDDPLNALGGK